MNRPDRLQQAFSRFGVALGPGEIAAVADHSPRGAILLLLANREIAARFDAAHGRPPEEVDLESLLDFYENAASRD